TVPALGVRTGAMLITPAFCVPAAVEATAESEGAAVPAALTAGSPVVDDPGPPADASDSAVASPDFCTRALAASRTGAAFSLAASRTGPAFSLAASNAGPAAE